MNKVFLFVMVMMLVVPSVSAATTVQIQDFRTGILEDADVWTGSYAAKENGFAPVMAASNTTTAAREIMIKYNISGIPSSQRIVNATQCFFMSNSYNTMTGGIEYFNITNYMVYDNFTVDNTRWDEGNSTTFTTADAGELTWNELPNKTTYDSNGEDSYNFSGNTPEGAWYCWNATNIVTNAYGLGYYNLSIWMHPHDGSAAVDSDDYVAFYSRNWTGSGGAAKYGPYINITYDPDDIDINSYRMFPSTAVWNDNVTVRANVTDLNGYVVSVNYTVTYPNGTVLIDHVNGTVYNTDFWNSSSFIINANGTWLVQINATEDDGYDEDFQFTFNIDLGTLDIKTPDNDHDHSFSHQAGDEELFNLTLLTDGNCNNTINYTFIGDLANDSIVFASATNFTLVNDTSTKSEINLTTNITVAAGSYGGYINVTRQEDTNYTLIEVNFTVSVDSGDVDFIIATFSAAVISSDFSYSVIDIWNKGNYNLTNCNMSISTSAPFSVWYNTSDFTITNTSNVSVNTKFTGTGDGSDSSSFLTVTCVATAGGGLDSDTIQGSLSSTEAEGGGGGGGGPPPVEACGDFTIYPSGRIEYFASEGQEGPVQVIQIFNGNRSQSFTLTFDEPINSFCSILKYPDERLPALAYGKFEFECVGPPEVYEKNLVITGSTGCDKAVPMTLGPSIGFLDGMSDLLRMVSAGDFDGFLIGYHGVPLIILILIIAGFTAFMIILARS